MTPEIAKKIEEAFQRHAAELMAAENDLTEKQVFDAFLQAIRAGDFKKVVSRHGQTVVYIPFLGRSQLLAKIAELEALLALYEAEGGELCKCGHRKDDHYNGKFACAAEESDYPCQCRRFKRNRNATKP